MIPFEYRTPKNLKEVHATLKEFGGDAKLIAGGTALVIMMKQRLGSAQLLGRAALRARFERHRSQRRRPEHRRSGDSSRSRKLCAAAPPLAHAGGNLSSCRDHPRA